MPKTRRDAGNSRTDEKLKPARYFSRAIGNALKILEMLRRSAEPLSLSQITVKCGLAKSSAFRILRTLEVAQYVEKTYGDCYALSPLLASAIPDDSLQKLIEVATPVAKELGRESRETISVAFLFKNHIEAVIALESPQRVQMGNMVGSVIPPHASSLGKCITANQPESMREQLLRKYGICWFTPKTLTDEVTINRELDLVRTQGYATDIEESALEGCCVGAPITGPDGGVIAAISISVPKSRFRNVNKLVASVRAAAAAISIGLRRPGRGLRHQTAEAVQA